MVFGHYGGGCLYGQILITGDQFRVVDIGNRQVEELSGIILGSKIAADNFGIGSIQHALAECVREIIGKGLMMFADIQEDIFW